MQYSTRKPIILLDIDGVVIDWIGGALKVVEDVAGKTLTADDITEWDIFEQHSLSEYADECYRRYNAPGFTLGLQPYAEAKGGVEWLKSIADIVVVTSPTWNKRIADAEDDEDALAQALDESTTCFISERAYNLKKHFGLKRNQLVFTPAKHRVDGDFLIDDKVENVAEWVKEQGGRGGLLWTRPWNATTNLPQGTTRVSSWSAVAQAVQDQGWDVAPYVQDQATT